MLGHEDSKNLANPCEPRKEPFFQNIEAVSAGRFHQSKVQAVCRIEKTARRSGRVTTMAVVSRFKTRGRLRPPPVSA